MREVVTWRGARGVRGECSMSISCGKRMVFAVWSYNYVRVCVCVRRARMRACVCMCVEGGGGTPVVGIGFTSSTS